jgi:hypothetical protein
MQQAVLIGEIDSLAKYVWELVCCPSPEIVVHPNLFIRLGVA